MRIIKKIQFFPQPILEFTEEQTYDTTKFEWTRLTDNDMELLRQVYNEGKGWTNDSVVDRAPFFFDGRIRFATTDSFGWMYFGFDQNVLYYNGMFTEINSKVMDILERVQEANNNGSNSSQANKNFVGHIQIKSGVNTIYPFGCLLWSKIDNEDGTFTEYIVDKYDVVDLVNGKTHLSVTDIPKLVLDESVSYFVQVNGQVEKVYLLTSNGNEYTKTETTCDALSTLADGTYYVVLEVLLSGNCDPDAPQHSYRYEDVFCLLIESEDELTHSGYEVEIKLLQYTWDGWGISTKTVGACDVAYNIIDALKAMRENGETIPKISDDVFEIGGGQYPVERGTMWIESSGKIYRLTPDLSQICLVETHFGEGKVLEITDEFKTNVNNAWYYAPYDYYKGTYNKGESTVELKSVFESGSSLQLSIKEIKVDSSYNPHSTIRIETILITLQSRTFKIGGCKNASQYRLL